MPSPHATPWAQPGATRRTVTTAFAHPAALVTSAAARTDPYAHLHKALRHALAGLLQQMGTLDPHDDGQVLAAAQEVLACLELQGLHGRLGAQFLHPALESRQPGLTQGATRHAEEALTRVAALRALAEQARDAPDPGIRQRLLFRLDRELGQHTALCLRQMIHEAQGLTPQFHALFSDAELQALQRQALGSVPRWERQALLLRMADGLSPEELAAVLLARRDDGTPEAWLAAAMALQQRLGATRWQAVARHLQAAGALPPNGPWIAHPTAHPPDQSTGLHTSTPHADGPAPDAFETTLKNLT